MAVDGFRGSEINCADCLRLTVGTREENAAFLEMLVKVAEEKGVV